MADYTRLSRTQLTEILSRYDLGGVISVKPQKGGQANSSFRVSTRKGEFMLSVCDEKDENEIRFLTRLLAHLNTFGFPAPRPVKTRDEKYVVCPVSRPVYVKTFTSGRVTPDISTAMAEQIGNALARLHNIPVPHGTPQQFAYGLNRFGEISECNRDHPFSGWLSEKQSFLATHLDPGMEKSLIHGDLFWDNLVFQNNRLAGVLDFEEACCYYRLFDLAMGVVGCCAPNGTFDLKRMDAMVKGYEQTLPLTGTEKAQLPVFMVYAATATAFWRFRQYNVYHPSPLKKDAYKPLAALADQAGRLISRKTV